jgi:AAA domain
MTPYSLPDDFLRPLYAGTEQGYLSLWCGNDKRTKWFDLAQLDGQVGRHVAELLDREWYFGVAPRREDLGPYQRGGKEDCLSIPALWLDVDVEDPDPAVHAAENLPKSIDAAWDLIRMFPLAPTVVVDSGHGLQVYWFLQEPLDADDAEYWLTRWQTTWENYAAERRVHIDNVSDIDRVMRIPGSINHKGTPEKSVHLVEADWSRLYGLLDDLDEVLADPPPPRAPSPHAGEPWLERDWYNDHYSAHDVFQEAGWPLVRQRGDRNDYKYPEKRTDGHSASVYPDGGITVWSSAELCPIPKGSYADAWGLYVHAFHRGDWVDACKTIRTRLSEEYVADVKAAAANKSAPMPLPKVLLAIDTNLATVAPVDVDWLWQAWLPRKKLVTLDGDPDMGKSTVLADLMARITTGTDMPDGSPGITGGGDVILLAAEDDADDTIVPRLLAAGADRNRIHSIDGVMDGDDEWPVTLPAHLDVLEERIRYHKAVLVVVDVLAEYLDDRRVDSFKDNSMRRALHLVRKMVRRTDATVVMVRHFRKAATDKAIHRGGGSIAIIGAARGGWVIASHPENEALRVLASAKMNLAPKPTPLGFMLRQHSEYGCAYVDWQGPVNIGTDQLLMPAAPAPTEDDQDKRSKVEQCKDALKQILGDGAEMWSGEMLEKLKPLNFSNSTIDTARTRLPVAARHVGKPEGPDKLTGWKVRWPGAPVTKT